MFKYFFLRELRESYFGNVGGILWIFIQPLILLVIYSVVFEKILHARFPDNANISFTVYLAIGFWPWLAFSESLNKSITSLTDNKNIIGKVKVNSIDLVQAVVTSSFTLQIFGYIIVLSVLFLLGKDLNISRVYLVFLPLLQLYLLSISLAYFLSSIQIFLKDVKNVFSTLITLWFFCTPIIYSKSMIPDDYHSYFKWNIIYFPITFLHEILLTTNKILWKDMIVVTLIIIFVYCISRLFYKKLEPNFEEFI